MSWYTKYRPTQIQDLDLKKVREFFLRLMKQGFIPQTFLFAGPRGTGKTSTSRILGAMLNDPANERAVDAVYFAKNFDKKMKFQEPDSSSKFNQKIFAGHSFVVQEMDAASNRGIDDIRALKKQTALAPSHGKMSVYILDEVHMLTKEAFNALLKVLEEPPAHVVFILATTELHKVPATIVSRCSLVEFYKADETEMLRSFKRVLDVEKIKYEEVDLKQIVKLADGSFRDGVKILEIVCQSGKFDLDALNTIAGGNLEQAVKDLVTIILAKDELKLSTFFVQLRIKNTPEKNFYQTLLFFLHEQLLIALQVKTGKQQVAKPVCQFLLKKLLSLDLIQESIIPFLVLEIALLELIAKAKKNDSGNGKQKISLSVVSKSLPKIAKKAADKVANKIEKNSDNTTKTLTKVSTETVGITTPVDKHFSKLIFDQWEKLLILVADKNTTLAALLRSGKPSEQFNGKALINVYYKFHQEQLQQAKFLNIIEECGKQIVGQRVPFEFILAKLPEKAELVEQKRAKNLSDLAEEILM